jgi:hypothetical protein
MRQFIRPAATASATLMAAAALAACGGSSSKSSAGGVAISDQHHQEYVAGCTKGGPSATFCECIYQQLTTKQGLNTEDKFKAVLVKVQTASASGNPTLSALPKEFTAATLACKAGGGSSATQ